LLKNFFFVLYGLLLNFSFYLFTIIIFVSLVLLFTSLRKKFMFFILVVLSYSIWGFLLDLDGMMLVLLTTEFTIVLLFLMTYIQLYHNFSFVTFYVNYRYLAIFLIFFIIFYEPLNSFYFYTNYYQSVTHIVSSDFYILYHFLFEKLPLLVILMTLIISFFSLFFINYFLFFIKYLFIIYYYFYYFFFYFLPIFFRKFTISFNFNYINY